MWNTQGVGEDNNNNDDDDDDDVNNDDDDGNEEPLKCHYWQSNQIGLNRQTDWQTD